MTLIAYTNNGPSPSTHHSRRRLAGTAHRGPAWTNAVHVLRAGVQNAVEHSGSRRSTTPDRVGSDIIDHIDQLDAKALHVLAVVFSMLVRASRQ
jgi:hypothetical protein